MTVAKPNRFGCAREFSVGIAKDEGASDTLVVINDLKEALALLAVKVDLTNIKVFIHQEL